ncbi:MAG: phosphopantetheine adenylyltransferase [Gammaproteobacteria bacterium]
MRHLISAMLVIVGVIHLLPLSGVLGGPRLAALYGIAVDGPDLAILMRHRAVLFGLLGVFLVVAAFRPAWQPAALVAGFVSVVSFLWLAWATGGYNAQLARVVTADLVALACLVVAAVAYAVQRREGIGS